MDDTYRIVSTRFEIATYFLFGLTLARFGGDNEPLLAQRFPC